MAKRVMIGMSGGVDSTGAALLLQKLGYEVSGVTLLLHDCADHTAPEGDVSAARRVAAQLGIPHTVLDLRDTFRREVMDHFVAEYTAGRTPNPCVDCNRTVKFGAMLDWALEQGADYIATGHYARVGYDSAAGRWQLFRGDDPGKDQSYVLYQLTQRQLSHLLLPVGDYSKPAIRALAAEAGLMNAQRKDSQDICFIPDGDYMDFLQRYGHVVPIPGNFVDEQGTVLGRHRGLERYTVGQRKGLGISADRPLYVLRKDLAAGTVVLGSNDQLFTNRLTACRVHWIAGEAPAAPIRAAVKTRYSQKEAAATVEPLPNGGAQVVFDQPQRAVTAGQAVVFYDGQAVLGGGTIL